jgi:hypothetical protein
MIFIAPVEIGVNELYYIFAAASSVDRPGLPRQVRRSKKCLIVRAC